MSVAFHPLANIFPLIEGSAGRELADDIAVAGVREALVIYELQILDGRNRYLRAIDAGIIADWMTLGELQKAGVPIRFYDPETEGDPLAFVLSLNLHRRHLTDSQRAAVAADLGKVRQGRPSEWNKPADLRDKESSSALADRSREGSIGQPRVGLKQSERAELLNVSERLVQVADAVKAHGVPEVFDAMKHGEIAGTAAFVLSRLPDDEQLEVLRSVPPRQLARAARERVGSGGRATQASRHEPADSLDFFPTPPWGTRTLIEDVLRLPANELAGLTVWDPACGEGHMTGVLEEYFGTVIGTDIFDYSSELPGDLSDRSREGSLGQPLGKPSAPAWRGVLDFLAEDSAPDDLAEAEEVDWIICNPPFSGEGDRALAFALRALRIARKGVALFVRTQWLEGINRYTRLFGVTPPNVVAQFAERISLFRGQWDPEGSKPDQYCWLVWVKDEFGSPCGMEWIRPGRQAERTRDSDEARFTAHPVLPIAVGPEAALAAAGTEPNEHSTSNSVATQRASLGAATAARDGAGEGVPAFALPASRLTKDEVLPILIARYATTPADELAAETGVPVNTLRTWAHRLGLTSHARLVATGKAKIDAINARRPRAAAEPGNAGPVQGSA